MKKWMVGGAVRDALLGRPVNDRDWVVVGASPLQLLEAGYLPVGKDFPVFLHPETKDEVALARTERKTAPGYHGFAFHADPSVTLEEDLQRRDLTINAMAQDEDGRIVDPWGGRRDLADKLLRHVSPAFAEDPVRILRLARFAARFDDFGVAPETQALMRHMVEIGEVDALVPERVWQELSRGLMEARPSRMFEVLRRCGALARLLPEVDRLWGVPQPPAHHPEVDTGLHLMLVLDMAARLDTSLEVRFACLGHDLGKGTTPVDELPRHIAHEARSVQLVQELSQRLKVPTDCRELAEAVAREHGNIHRSLQLDGSAVMRLFDRCDVWRRPARFSELLLACECDARGRTGFEERPYPQRPRLQGALDAALSVDTAKVSSDALARGWKGTAIGAAIRHARYTAVSEFLAAQPQPQSDP
ncbi:MULTISPECIES: multifunctional CCA addition/repair protein [unclassified Rhizobacter]|uniref:multifunctional CCA addition/repair protein n=1 Tax=unclassified Rhizobacter TaxID=2640088 RepID=UPI0006F3785D|nr:MULTISPECIES: multifunctional CCA addition/repair protein [unclassified Rhizobacter]KQU67846.1 phosphatase [Rhizobacter sp. Root29]KQW15267.1 phosphatase [Rhizobacter sp. Root1238]KRB24431.1 phosphatase [Rhizobacter sp. Root16D2]